MITSVVTTKLLESLQPFVVRLRAAIDEIVNQARIANAQNV
jgi:hypothetical protein